MTEQIVSLKQRNARIRKSLRDKLGPGVWGLEEKDKFSHEEIVFLFARVFPVFGFEFIKEVRTSFPDCICVKNNEEVAIEFESVLSDFSDHINNDDLSKCQYIVCWKDDVGLYSSIKEEIQKHNIEIIELKTFYEEAKIKDRTVPKEWSLKEMRFFTENKLKLLYAFVVKDQDILTSKEISEFMKIHGKGLGGVIGGFSKSKEWLIRKHPNGWKFNKKYKQRVIKVIKEVGADIGII